MQIMDYKLIITAIITLILALPLLLTFVSRTFLNKMFEIALHYAKKLGFLQSINGVIRVGKTSAQSGLKHLYEIDIQQNLIKIILQTKQVFNYIDFRILDHMIEERLNEIWKGEFKLGISYQIEFDNLTQDIINWFKEIELKDLKSTIIFNFTSAKKSEKYIEDYVFAYFCLNYRKNYVLSKTPIYSHITGSMSYQLDPEEFKINDSYNMRKYAIYDYMVMLVDEYSDDFSASARYDDMKETSGVKDYLRKFGQIHQERNRLITTKQDVKDEIKKLRNLTQSNLWIPIKVEQRGTSRMLYKFIKFIYSSWFRFYDLTIVLFRYIKQKHKISNILLNILIYITYLIFLLPIYLFTSYSFEFPEFKEFDYKRINIKRHIEHRLLHIDWFLFSVGFNKYEMWNYASEEDVKKRDPSTYEKLMFYIPIQYCFGTYDTHYWSMIQKELLTHSQTVSNESNWFNKESYYKQEEDKGSENDDIEF